MYINQVLGQFGEDKACDYLIKNNYIILDRNFRCSQGEIDIIAKDVKKNELVFIEVKTRSNFKYGVPSEAVTNMKKRHFISASKYYLFQKNIKNTFIRFDIIEIFPKNNSFQINHIIQVF